MNMVLKAAPVPSDYFGVPWDYYCLAWGYPDAARISNKNSLAQ